jgi:hypothetical protein
MPSMPLDALAPDQRAVVQLVLQRGRSYAQIAELLKISEDAVRARAHAGLIELGPDVELPADDVAGIADFLLGQQNGKPRQSTRKLLRDSDAAYLWAATVRASLEGLGPVPELPASTAAAAAPDAPEEPAETPDKPAPRPRPLRESRPRTRPVGATEPEGAVAASSSRLGGALLIGGGVLVVVVVVLFLFVFGGDDDKGSNTSASATATPTASATPQAVGQIALKGAGPASRADGIFALFLQGQQQLLFAVEMRNMPATPEGTKYALWLTGPGKRAKWIGDTPDVAKDGVLQVQGPRQQDTSFTKDIGGYRRVLLTQERGESRAQPGTTLARGTLQRG